MAGQRVAQSADELQRLGVVSMNAQGAHAVLVDQAECLLHRLLGVLDEGVGPGARHQAAVVAGVRS